MKSIAFLFFLAAIQITFTSCLLQSTCSAQNQTQTEVKKETPALASRESQLLDMQNSLDEAEASLVSVQKSLGEKHEITIELTAKRNRLKSMLESAKGADSKDTKHIAQMLAYQPRKADAIFDVPKYPMLASFSIFRHGAGDCGYDLTYRGQTIRRFLDTDRDQYLDRWIYFKDGVESYRESGKDKDTVSSWQYTDGDAVRVLFDRNGDGEADESFEGNVSDLRTLGMQSAVREKVLVKTRPPHPDCLLPAGQRKIEDTLPPKRFVASIGGFASRSFRVEFADGKLTYRQNPKGFAEWGGTSEEVPVTEKMWIEFRDRLNDAEVWKWRRRYEEPDMRDGCSWEFEIEYSGQSISSSGSNRYPSDGKFSKFLDAVSALSKGKTFK